MTPDRDVHAGGFGDEPRDAAAVFRAALDAMARPGRVHEVTGARPPRGLSQAAGAILLTLADAGTPVWLPHRLADGPVAQWLTFHTGARQAAAPGSAVFAVGQWAELAPLDAWPAGEPAYPDRSATLIVEVATLSGGPRLRLTGPGIETAEVLAPALPGEAAAALAANAGRYPLGVDLFFTAARSLAALPRTTTVEG